MTIGAIIQIATYSTAQMIVGRIIAGIGNGMNTSTAPVWQSETSKANWRGKLVVIEMIMNIAGFSLSNWVTYGFSYTKGPVSWRFPLAFQLIFMIILFATVPWLPESPRYMTIGLGYCNITWITDMSCRWLIAHGGEDEAVKILADLEDTTIDDAAIITAFKEIEYAVGYERDHGVSWWDLLRGKTGNGTATVRRLVLGAGTQAIQQLVCRHLRPLNILTEIDM